MQATLSEKSSESSGILKAFNCMDEKQKADFVQLLAGKNQMSLNTKGIEDIANQLRTRHNGSSSGGSLLPPDMSTNNTTNWSTNGSSAEPLSVSNNAPIMQLSCVECGITKNNSEDMEVHIKMEHLNWLPFQCPICLSERASDAQMREHLHSSHKKNMNKFIYVDNVTAKRQLHVLMDKALSLSVTKRVAASSGNNSNAVPKTNGKANGGPPEKKFTNNDLLKFLDMATEGQAKKGSSPPPLPKMENGNRKRSYLNSSIGATAELVEPTGSSADLILESITNAAKGKKEDEENDQPALTFEDFDLHGASSALASLFGPAKKPKLDYDDDVRSNGENENGDDGALDALNPISVLDNVVALFGSSQDRVIEEFTVKPSKTPNVAKKRVLGECSKCLKPVTAGARQMHMFYHLAKDENIFRFRCKFPDCLIEHYRKDQMENHHSKVHGRIDVEMMEDRSLELFQKCQELNHELFVAHRHKSTGGGASSSSSYAASSSSKAATAAASANLVSVGGQSINLSHLFPSATPTTGEEDLSMELLGTKSGTTPGPTAAKAEEKYNAQQQALREKQSNKNRHHASTPVLQAKVTPDEDHPLQCRLCGKTMQNRIRGFHILWHMARDRGINRYTCKYCNFGHDRSQSVQVHGKKEHGLEECVEDRIGEYQDDVKEMSEECFGFQALFAQDGKKRSKIPLALTKSKNSDELGDSGGSSPSNEDDEILSDVMNLKEDLDIDLPLTTLKQEAGSMVSTLKSEAVAESSSDVVEPEDEEEQEEDEDEEETEGEDLGSSKKKRKSTARFGIRPKVSKGKKEEMALLRNVSMVLGGAQYFRKKLNESAYCEKCGKVTNSRMSEHACSHLDAPLFVCPVCDLGHQCRETVQKHLREVHPKRSDDKVIDNRLIHAGQIKETIRECYPLYFIDQPLPTEKDVQKLADLIKGNDKLSVTGVEEYLERLKSEQVDEGIETPDDDEITKLLENEGEGDQEMEESEVF